MSSFEVLKNYGLMTVELLNLVLNIDNQLTVTGAFKNRVGHWGHRYRVYIGYMQFGHIRIYWIANHNADD